MLRKKVMLSFLGLGLFLASAVGAWAEDKAATTWRPFDFSNGQVVFDVMIGGHPARAVLDTGSEVNGVSLPFLEAHEIPFERVGKIPVEGVHDTAWTPIVGGIPLELLGVKTEVGRAIGTQRTFPDSLLGQDFFEAGVVQIDYPNRRLRLLARDGVDVGKFANTTTRKLANSPFFEIRIKIEGEDAWLALDTGFSGALYLDRRLADDFEWNAVEPEGSVQGQGFMPLGAPSCSARTGWTSVP